MSPERMMSDAEARAIERVLEAGEALLADGEDPEVRARAVRAAEELGALLLQRPTIPAHYRKKLEAALEHVRETLKRTEGR